MGVAYQARFLRLIVFLEAGDLASADAEAEAGRHIADELKLPAYLPWVGAYSATRAWIRGDFDEAQRLNQAVLEQALATQPDPDTVFAMIGGQSFVFCYLRPELDGVADVLAGMSDQFPGLTALRSARALVEGVTGRLDACRSTLDAIGGLGLSTIGRDSSWLVNVGMLVSPCEHLGDAALARDLHDVLLPFADRWASGVTLTFGPVRTMLSALCRVMGDVDGAWDHAREAAASVGPELPLFRAEACLQAGLAALARGPADRASAQAWLDESLALARRLGLTHLERRVGAALGG